MNQFGSTLHWCVCLGWLIPFERSSCRRGPIKLFSSERAGLPCLPLCGACVLLSPAMCMICYLVCVHVCRGPFYGADGWQQTHATYTIPTGDLSQGL